MHNKWFSWTSHIGIIYMFYKVAYIAAFKEKFNITLWFSFFWRLIAALTCIVVLPTHIFLYPLNWLYAFNRYVADLYNLLVWVYIYLAGVYVLKRLIHWADSNLPIQ